MQLPSSMDRKAKKSTTPRRVMYEFSRALCVAYAAVTLTTAPVHSRESSDVPIHSELSEFRYGISVTDLEGNVLVAHRADERFVPASNTKLFVTAAALAAETELAALDSGLRVVSEPATSGPTSLALIGRGDPTIGFGPDCDVRCIETLAKAVAASGIIEIGDIIGDDQWFADERKPLGWSWDDLKFGHGTSISAIAVNDNVLPLRVWPSTARDTNVWTSWANSEQNYFNLNNEAKTSEAQKTRALR